MKRFYGVDFEKQREAVLNSEKARFIADGIIKKADEALKKIYPAFKMSEFMLYFETGNRSIFEKSYFERRNDCLFISIAYWLTGDEKYYKPLIDLIFMICDEFTWCLPAHVAVFRKNPPAEEMIEIVDLFSSETSRLLTDIIAAVGDKLPYYVKERVEYEIRRRVFEPLKKYDFYWKNGTNNWAAVCAGGCGVALLHLGTQEEIDVILPMLYNAMETFLSGFNDDGCCMEGYAYWNYGFGYFVIFARMILDYTNGEVNYFERDKVKNIALFPQHILMSDNKVVSFSDGGSGFTFSPGLMSYLKSVYGDEFIRPDLSLAHMLGNVYSIKELLWFDCDYETDKTENSTYYFDGAEWYINKKEKFSFAAKGGHNDEPHNHNDIGSFMICTSGNDIPLADFGCGVYVKDTFDDRVRYTLINNGSHGHSVPVINGKYQCFGKEYSARNIEMKGDFFALDIEGAYENDIVNKIRRSFEIKENSVVLRDRFEYSDKTESVTERMVTWTKPVIGEGYVDLGTAEVKFDKNRYQASVSEDVYRSHDDTHDVTVYLIDYTPVIKTETDFEFEIEIKG